MLYDRFVSSDEYTITHVKLHHKKHPVLESNQVLVINLEVISEMETCNT